MCSYYNTLFYRRTIGLWSFQKHKKAYKLHSVINKYYCLILSLLEDVLKLLHSNILLNYSFFLSFPKHEHITSLKQQNLYIELSLQFTTLEHNFLKFSFLCLKAVCLLAVFFKTFTTTLKLTCWKPSEIQDNFPGR